MPRLITKTAHRIEVELAAEEQLLLWFRDHHGSWRAVLTWLRRNAPHRMAEIRPIIRRLQALSGNIGFDWRHLRWRSLDEGEGGAIDLRLPLLGLPRRSGTGREDERDGGKIPESFSKRYEDSVSAGCRKVGVREVAPGSPDVQRRRRLGDSPRHPATSGVARGRRQQHEHPSEPVLPA